jgi:hypothetical protein
MFALPGGLVAMLIYDRDAQPWLAAGWFVGCAVLGASLIPLFDLVLAWVKPRVRIVGDESPDYWSCRRIPGETLPQTISRWVRQGHGSMSGDVALPVAGCVAGFSGISLGQMAGALATMHLGSDHFPVVAGAGLGIPIVGLPVGVLFWLSMRRADVQQQRRREAVSLAYLMRMSESAAQAAGSIEEISPGHFMLAIASEPDALAQALLRGPDASAAELQRIARSAIDGYGESPLRTCGDELLWLAWFIQGLVSSAAAEHCESVDSGHIVLGALPYDETLRREFSRLLGFAVDEQSDDPLAALRERIASLRKTLGAQPD